MVLTALVEWRAESAYKSDEDFLFPSIRKNGRKPVTPDMVLKRSVRPALARAGVIGKVIGWHSFRHTLATNLRNMGVDVKVSRELLRHANSRITLDLNTHAVSSQKHEATRRIVELLLPVGTEVPAPSAPSAEWLYP